jgi:Rab3 GTPase-activating protein catalytic subunit
VKKKELSARMKIPGNMWIEVWSSARPVPARRQKRLFDDTKEAERVMTLNFSNESLSSVD